MTYSISVFIPRIVRALMVMLLWACVAQSGTAAPLSVQVTDPHGRVMVEAHVRLFAPGDDGRLLRRGLTDLKGEVRFESLPAGTYRLEVFAASFQKSESIVTLGEEEQRLEIQLALAGVHEGVVVTATRQEGETLDTPLPSSLISAQTLERQVPSNLAQALEEIPGVNWINAGAFRGRPVIRGLDSNRILILVDGERLNNSRTSTDDAGIETGLVDVSQIEQVEVVRGPGSVLYGSDAFGGVVNIRTRTAEPSSRLRFGARVRTELFSNGDGRRANVDGYATSGRFGLRLAGSVGAFQDYQSPAGTVFRSGVDENSALGEFRYYPKPHRSLYFKFLDRNALNFGFPDVLAVAPFESEFPYSKLRKYSAGYQASYASGVFTAVQLRFHGQQQARDFVSLIRTPMFNIQTDSRTDVDTAGFEFQASSLAARRHALTYGVTFYRDHSQDLRAQFLLAGPSSTLLSLAPSVPNSALTGTGIFLQDQVQVARRLRLTGGVRFDRFTLTAEPTPNFDPQAFGLIATDRDDTAVTGNLGASFDLLNGWVLTGQVARAFREPNLFERYFFGRGPFGGLLVPNPDLQPETAVEFDIGTRVQRGPLRTSLHYFVNNLRDQLVRVPATFQGQPVVGGQPVFQNVNVEKSRIQGVESSTELDFERGNARWSPFLMLAWQRGNNLSQDEPLPFIAPFVAQVGVRWQPKGARAWGEWRTRVAGGTDNVAPGLLPISGFTVHSWRWGYEVVHGEGPLGGRLPKGLAGLNFHFAFENATNKLYRGLFETVPQPGRSLRFGLELNLDNSAR